MRGRRGRGGGQGRTVNFRYGTPRKAGSGRRDKKASPQVAAPEDDSFLLHSIQPPPPPPLARSSRARTTGKTVRREAAVVPTKVSLKIRGTPHDRQRGEGGYTREGLRSLIRRRQRRLRSSDPRIVIARRSPTRNLARRKYGLMSSSSFSSFFFFFARFSFSFYTRCVLVSFVASALGYRADVSSHLSISARHVFYRARARDRKLGK